MKSFYTTVDGYDWNMGCGTVEKPRNIGPILYGNQIYYLDTKFVNNIPDSGSHLQIFGDNVFNSIMAPITIDDLQDDNNSPGSLDLIWRLISSFNTDFEDYQLWLGYYNSTAPYDSVIDNRWMFMMPFDGLLIDYNGLLYKCSTGAGSDITWNYYGVSPTP